MSSTLDIPPLERPSFFDGQRLTAADLTDVQTFHRELRWLHNRSLHNWGIAFGYAVSGARGQRTVQIQSGYALDCKGRELILNESTSLPIPAVAAANDGGPATYYLTVTYAEDADLTPEMRAGACGTAGAVRRPEQPLIRWRDPDEGYEHGIDVVVAAIKVQNCRLAEDVSGAERRDAVPAQQPYVAAGRSDAGQTVWRLWPDAETAVGVATTVATTAAGFRTVPRYQAHVMGERLFPFLLDGENFNGVVDGYPQIVAPSAASFDLVVALPRGFAAQTGAIFNPAVVLTQDFMTRLQEELQWHVVWMGIEG